MLVAALGMLQDPDAGPVKLKWKVPKDHFVRYKAFTFDPKDPDKLTPGFQRVAGVFGYEILDDTRYVAQPKDDRDVPMALCLTLPAKALAVKQSIPFESEFELASFGTIGAKGTTTRRVSESIGGAPCVVIAHTSKFTTRKPGPSTMKLDDGGFDATIHFDAELGVARRIRFTWTYSYSYDVSGKKQTYTLAQNEVLELLKVLPPRYVQFETDVSAAIDKGVEAIWKKYDDKTTSWGAMGEHKTGQSALALLAILKGSLDRKDPRIRPALDWLLAQPLEQTYDVGVSLLTLEAFYSPKDPEQRFKPGEVADKDIAKHIEKKHLEWAKTAVRWLLEKQQSNGMWHYPMKDFAGTGDYSNTQYGVLGLLAGSRMGTGVDPNAVSKALKGYLESQQKTGPRVDLKRTDQETPGKKPSTTTRSEEKAEARGWGYGENPGETVYGSMTLGGIGSITILESICRRTGMKYDAAKVAAAKRDGWAWMQSNWTVKSNAKYGASWYCYYLYAMERAGMLTGTAMVGTHDWYYEGAVLLISNQGEDGNFWNSPIYDLAFCVLFLKRATTNVATGK